MNEVAAIMGTPQTVSNFGSEVWWYYGYSKIVFKDSRVAEWDNAANNLKVKWISAPTKEDAVARTYPQQSVTSSVPVPASPPLVPSADARKIDAQVAAIIAGEHSPLPPSQQVRTDAKSQVAEMITKNNTEHTLTVLYSGPTSQRVVLVPNGSKKILLAVGMYQVAATVDAPSVLPFAGRDDIRGGAYDNTFYIQTSLR